MREVQKGWAHVCDHSSFVLGDEVEIFEKEYADLLGIRHCIGVGNGTDALELALRAVGVRPGSEVLLPANTFAATPMAVLRAGGVPVLADCDAATGLMNIDEVPSHLTDRTKAVIPVHLYGQAVPVERLTSLIGNDEIVIVEDAAQSHGATRLGFPVGGFGTVSATSFYPSKNLGAFGDAGAVLTSSDDVSDAVTVLRNYGTRISKYRHEVIGFNSRLDSIQAVVLRAKLLRLRMWNAQRAQAAELYSRLLVDVDEVELPVTYPGNEHVWHLYVVRVPNRDHIQKAMRDDGIAVEIHYPTPIHLQPAFAGLGYARGDFPVAEAIANRVLSLPIFPGISESQQLRVVESLKAVLASLR